MKTLIQLMLSVLLGLFTLNNTNLIAANGNSTTNNTCTTNTDKSQKGIQFFEDEPRAWGIYDTYGEEGGLNGGFGGEYDDDLDRSNNTSRTYRDIRQMIVSAELV